MITFKNTKLIDKQSLKHCKSLSEFILDKFFTKQKQLKMHIDIHFVKGLFKNENHFGNCVWEDEHRRGNEFTIQIEPEQKINLLLNTIAHEMIHVKQWAKGEYYELMYEPKVYKFNGKRVDSTKIDYWDRPWEIEANGRAIGLVVQWAKKNEIAHEDLVFDG